MKKQILTFFALWGTIITTQCMISNPSFKPYTQVKNPEIQKSRDEKKYYEQNIKIGEISNNNDGFRCFQYALQEVTGFKGNVSFPGQGASIFIGDFFEQIPNPQPNDLVIYTPDGNNYKIQHFAVAIDNVTFRSKFGNLPSIWRHKLFDVLETYGNAAWFYTLKQKYKIPENRPLLLSDIEKSIARERKFDEAFNEAIWQNNKRIIKKNILLGMTLAAMILTLKTIVTAATKSL